MNAQKWDAAKAALEKELTELRGSKKPLRPQLRATTKTQNASARRRHE